MCAPETASKAAGSTSTHNFEQPTSLSKQFFIRCNAETMVSSGFFSSYGR